MHFAFAKYHGAGNDFILVDDRTCFFPVADFALIERLCHRQFGIGADGLLIIQPSKESDITMRIFNSDGKEAMMCGNGLRCVAHFLGKNSVAIETPGRIVKAKVVGDLVTVDMGEYHWLEELKWDNYHIHLVDIGVPHAVVFVNALEQKDFVNIARKIRFHPDLQPEGANVNFAEIREGQIFIRTYERGVEDETLACGTGGAAVGIVASKVYSLLNPISCVPASGETMEVEVDQNRVRTTGPATLVFKGSITI